MEVIRRAYLELHLAVFLFGFTAILGDLIRLSPLLLVWWRALITGLSLLLVVRLRNIRRISRPVLGRFLFIGVLMALQWLTFYGAIKLANASLTLVALATTAFFTSFLEPLVMRQRIKWYETALGLLIIPGMALIVDSTGLSMMGGLAMGLLSAFLAGLFGAFNKKYIGESDEMTIIFLELGSAWLFLSLALTFFLAYSEESPVFWPSPRDWVYLALLSLVCTTLAYFLALRSLRHLSAFASNLTINLEPVYGIILAWLILHENEELDSGFYWGGCIILSAVFVYPWLRNPLKNR